MPKPFKRIPRSQHEADRLDQAARLLPASARTPTMSLDSAIVVQSGRGSKIVDLSGNTYIDYLLGSGPMFVGHAHPKVVAAVSEALGRGTSFLLPNEASIELAEQIVEATPCAERVVYGSTGTDGVFFAIRLARAFRRRDKILKFEGAYHGQSDPVLMSNQWTKQPVDFPAAVPNSIGLPSHAADEVVIAPWNDIETTAKLIEQYQDELACVIAEPMQRTIPPKGDFLHALREITARLEIPLIFDEVVTGFRFGYGSAQAYYGVTPDLCAMGKSLSAGHPISVVCGKSDLMVFAEGVRRLTGDYVSLTGTFSGNMISCTAGLAVLEVLREEGVYEGLFERGQRLRDGVQRACEAADIAVQMMGEPPAFEPWFTATEIVDYRTSQTADAGMAYRFAQGLFDRGILKGHEKFFISTAHTDEDIDVTLDAVQDVVQELARARRQA
jgi:glutamate-1-semialdehyde 2,1-aminomutase